MTKKITVIGDSMLDQYIIGEQKTCPEGNKFIQHGSLDVLGGAANVAFQLALKGVDVELVSFMDSRLKDCCDYSGLSSKFCLFTDQTTVKKRYWDNKVLLRQDHDHVHVDGYEQAGLMRLARESTHGSDVVLFCDYNKGVLQHTKWRMWVDAKTTAMADPYPNSSFDWTGINLVKMNFKECERMEPKHKTIHGKVECISKATGVGDFVITLGENGAFWRYDNAMGYHPRSETAKPIISTIGAGDAFFAALAVYYQHNELGVATKKANQDAAEYCTRKFNGVY